MRPYDKEIENIKKQIMDQYHPSDIILFGSCAKGAIHKGSDIDLCVILETVDKRQTIRNMLLDVNYDIDLDIVVYTPAEWSKYKDDNATMAGVIHRTGVSLVGRHQL